MTRRIGRAFGLALASASLLAAAPAGAATEAPGKPAFDVRESQPARPAVPNDAAALRARDRLSAQLGRQGILDIDERTGTPRIVARLDGFLTGPSDDDPARIALDYVRAHPDVFRLAAGDIAALRLARRYTDPHGVTHVIWAQAWRGIEVWDNELRASVTGDGRLINIGGSPIADLATRTPKPELTAGEALSEALGDAGRRGLAPRPTRRQGGADEQTSFAGGHEARLVLFAEGAGDVRLAWKVTDFARPAEVYDHLIDARSGGVLYRENRVNAIDAQVQAFEYTPADGPQLARTVPVDDDAKLKGPHAHVFADVDANTVIEDFDADVAGAAPIWNDAFSDKCAGGFCSWTGAANSWQDNLPQAAQQGYYFADVFHDWLLSEVGFTDATGGFGSADILEIEVFTGANDGGDGLPSRRNNAFASTDSNGQGSLLSFFLYDGGRDAVNDGTIFGHEYGHLLTNRLVIRTDGSSGLGAYQSDAMGEGWSDWYALDYLVAKGLVGDTAADGELAVGGYAKDHPRGVRSDNIDCPVGSSEANCPTNKDTFGEVSGVGVHSDGQVWAQTLWDLRTALGGDQKARRLITQALRLSPTDPSYIDMRNAIFQADQVLFGGAHRATIWDVFAARGMGIHAFTADGDDTSPQQDFTDAPAPGSGVAVSGRVTDAETGAALANALVELGSLPGDLTGRTDASGNYSIADLAPGTYPRARISAPGYSPVRRSVTVGTGGARVDQSLVRNFAAASGGAKVVSATGADFSNFDCGRDKLIDGELPTVWANTSQDNPASPGEKLITIELASRTDVRAFRIDPGAGCGDDDTASTGAFRVETSADGQSFSRAAAGTFSAPDNHRLNQIAANRDGVRFVRFVMEAPQSQAPGSSGEEFLDAAELEVLGAPTRPPAPQNASPGGPSAQPAPAPSTADGPAGLGVTIDRAPPRGTRLGLAARQRLRTALAKGLRLSVDCNEPCSARISAQLDAKTAKRLKLLPRRSRAKSVRVALGTLRMGEGRRTAKLKFTRNAKLLLKRRRSIKLSLRATLTDRSGNSGVRTARVRVRR